MKITSVMPVYNGEQFLRRAVDSFLAQGDEGSELVIVDGKSTDGSHGIIEEYVAKHPSKLLWVKEMDRGLSHARNIGVSAASGEIVGFLAADDVLHRGTYEKIRYYASVFYFDIMYFSCLVNHEGLKECLSNKTPMPKFTRKNLARHGSLSAGECFYYRRGIFEKYEFDETLKCTMDYEFNLRLASEGGYTAFALNEPGLISFLHETNISSAMSDLQRKEHEMLVKRYSSWVERVKWRWRR